VAGANRRFTRQKGLPVGTQIQKKWGQLGYEVNGDGGDFPVYAYSATFGAAFFAYLLGGAIAMAI